MRSIAMKMFTVSSMVHEANVRFYKEQVTARIKINDAMTKTVKSYDKRMVEQDNLLTNHKAALRVVRTHRHSLQSQNTLLILPGVAETIKDVCGIPTSNTKSQWIAIKRIMSHMKEAGITKPGPQLPSGKNGRVVFQTNEGYREALRLISRYKYLLA
jgi:hypothetical protein